MFTEPTDLIAFQDRTLEELRRLISLKEAVGSDEFAHLADGVENEELRNALMRLREDAEGERAELEDLVRAWMLAGGSQEVPEVGSREIVIQWADLHESAGRRMRYAAAFAPTQGLRARLRGMATRDERHARNLRALL